MLFCRASCALPTPISWKCNIPDWTKKAELVLRYLISGGTVTQPPGNILQTILTNTERLIEMSTTTTNSLANLQAAVAAETTVNQSVLALLTTLAAELQAASPTGDNPAIDAVVTTMNANAASLAAAVSANTPAAPAA